MFGRSVQSGLNQTILHSIRYSHTMGLPLKTVVEKLNSFANLKLAASWDNVGLLIEPTEPKDISHILLTNDLTEDVMQEAVDVQTDFILSYHPPIFSPLKSITTRTWKERIAAKCLENKIALYSPHTSFDSINGGVNDWLAAAFDPESSGPIEPGLSDPRTGFGRFCTLKKPISIEDAVKIVKERTELSHVRLARKCGSADSIRTVALCAGSGTSVFKSSPQADLYLTGEMFHHDILDLTHKGGNVILTNHSDSERGYLKEFSKIFTELVGNSVKVQVSQKDKDPLITV
ncbi:NIF3-like protein 1 isoform X2 [Leptopilina heterotoma]|uniref:NIF3-like protein 1 isoform X2 n=1 Tax=Leptopilina heterotoma TaxID=63436 RepID=UPI001CA7E48C|nr:NIF3-like protein 1 isoform X2 [Leptopilina heterotoma]